MNKLKKREDIIEVIDIISTLIDESWSTLSLSIKKEIIPIPNRLKISIKSDLKDSVSESRVSFTTSVLNSSDIEDILFSFSDNLFIKKDQKGNFFWILKQDEIQCIDRHVMYNNYLKFLSKKELFKKI